MMPYPRGICLGTHATGFPTAVIPIAMAASVLYLHGFQPRTRRDNPGRRMGFIKNIVTAAAIVVLAPGLLEFIVSGEADYHPANFQGEPAESHALSLRTPGCISLLPGTISFSLADVYKGVTSLVAFGLGERELELSVALLPLDQPKDREVGYALGGVKEPSLLLLTDGEENDKGEDNNYEDSHSGTHSHLDYEFPVFMVAAAVFAELIKCTLLRDARKRSSIRRHNSKKNCSKANTPVNTEVSGMTKASHVPTAALMELLAEDDFSTNKAIPRRAALPFWASSPFMLYSEGMIEVDPATIDPGLHSMELDGAQPLPCSKHCKYSGYGYDFLGVIFVSNSILEAAKTANKLGQAPEVLKSGTVHGRGVVMSITHIVFIAVAPFVYWYNLVLEEVSLVIAARKPGQVQHKYPMVAVYTSEFGHPNDNIFYAQTLVIVITSFLSWSVFILEELADLSVSAASEDVIRIKSSLLKVPSTSEKTVSFSGIVEVVYIPSIPRRHHPNRRRRGRSRGRRGRISSGQNMDNTGDYSSGDDPIDEYPSD